jgi:site-specific recombinase XerD
LELSKPPREAVDVAAVVERMRSYAAASRAENTWKAYKSDLKQFASWCAELGVTDPVPAEPRLVAAYLAEHAGELAVSTLSRRLYALTALHRIGGHPPPADAPEVQAVWNGIKRTHGTAPAQKAPARTKVITAMLDPLDDEEAIDVRDRALLLIGFAGAFRRSELVAFDVDDITDADEGLHIVVRKSKSDQEGEGAVVGLPYGANPATCPVRAWRAWLTVRDENELTDAVPAFLSITKGGKISENRLPDRSVANIVKRRAAAAGLDGDFAAHSLRAGFATEAFSNTVQELLVMRHGRWKSSSSMRGYIREGSLWGDNAAAKLGL